MKMQMTVKMITYYFLSTLSSNLGSSLCSFIGFPNIDNVSFFSALRTFHSDRLFRLLE